MLIWLSAAHKTAALWPEFTPLFIYKIEWASPSCRYPVADAICLFFYVSKQKITPRGAYNQCTQMQHERTTQTSLSPACAPHQIFEPRRLILAFVAEECHRGWWRKRAWPNIIEQRRWAITGWPGAAHVMVRWVRHFSVWRSARLASAGLAS